MIAETQVWVVLVRSEWERVTKDIRLMDLRRNSPYATAETIFDGRCVEVRETLGL